MLESVLIPIVAIVCIFALPVIFGSLVLLRLINANSQERLELARHGIVAPVRPKPSPNKYRTLRNGILCIGIAIGIAIGTLIVLNGGYREYIEFLIISSSTIMCLGLGYLVFYLIVKNKKLENEEY